ncbi:MAG: hypothetical protein HY887_03520 [Deltaproteobacteria bacterium]|nr:hypothetical protein [Deltaproteobacteria bacterium]
MHIRRFTAPTVKEALAAIKAEFGPDALILGTKKLKEGPASMHEVTAAIEHEPVRPRAAPVVDKGGALGKAGYEMEEALALKDLCWEFLTGRGRRPNAMASLKDEMVRSGIDERLVQKIFIKTFSSASKDKTGSHSHLKSLVREKVYERLAVKDPLAEKGVYAFIGPPGVGKTTTIAKLAAVHALKEKRSVALFTLDTYRIAAALQLKVYARILGVPCEVASRPADMRTLLPKHADKDIILIDTAGRGAKDVAYAKELFELAALNPRIRFNLVLSTVMRDEGLYSAIAAGKDLPVDCLTFTKLDESPLYGAILNSMFLAKRPVSYITAGQRVPEDIEAATKERLLDFIIPN